jgi:hypothetical protein
LPTFSQSTGWRTSGVCTVSACEAVAAATVSVTVSVSVSVPSLVAMVSVTLPEEPVVGVNTRPLSPALTWTMLPAMVTLRVPLLVIVAPPPVGAVRVPVPTGTDTTDESVPPSWSSTVIGLPVPVENMNGVSCATVCVPEGTVFTGGRLPAADATVSVMVSTSVATPSVVLTVRVTVPLDPSAGRKLSPNRAALMLVGVPKIVTFAVPLFTTLAPTPVTAVSVPEVTVRVVDRLLPSGSATVIVLPFAPEKTRAVSWATFCGPGTVFTGGLLLVVPLPPLSLVPYRRVPSERNASTVMEFGVLLIDRSVTATNWLPKAVMPWPPAAFCVTTSLYSAPALMCDGFDSKRVACSVDSVRNAS